MHREALGCLKDGVKKCVTLLPVALSSHSQVVLEYKGFATAVYAYGISLLLADVQRHIYLDVYLRVACTRMPPPLRGV